MPVLYVHVSALSLPQTSRNWNRRVTHRHTYRQTSRHTDIHTDRQADTQTDHCMPSVHVHWGIKILRQGEILFAKFPGVAKVPALHRVVQSGTSDWSTPTPACVGSDHHGGVVTPPTNSLVFHYLVLSARLLLNSLTIILLMRRSEHWLWSGWKN